MSWTIPNPERYSGKVVANGQCVRFVQEVGGMPHTSHWRRGAKVRGSHPPKGTVIATFDPNGRYGNHTDGRSHAAVFVGEQQAGLDVWDQWSGQPVHQRLIRFRGGAGKKVNDGDAFHVVIAEDEQPTS